MMLWGARYGYHRRMASLDDKLWDLIEAAQAAQRTPHAVAVLEEGVRIADAHNDDEWSWDLRDRLVDAAYFSGAPERAIAAFSWMIAKCDAEPERWDEYDILWKYKWIAEHFPFMHQIDRSTIDRTLDDMQARYERAGYDRRPVTNLRAWNALWQGDLDAMSAWRREWWERPRDSMADCWACELNYNTQYLVEEGRPADALRQARKILDRTQGCAEIPHITFGYIIWTLLDAGRQDEAHEVHRAGYELIRQNHDFVMEIGEHIAFAAHVGEVEAAVAMLERHLPWAIGNAAWLKDGHLIAAGEGLLARLERQGVAELPIRLPREIADELGEDNRSTAAVRTWLEHRRTQIGDAFDARNATTFVSERLARLRSRAAES